MVKHCSHGTCKSDSRYPVKLSGAKFIPFAKPKSDIQKCLRWISLCRRPHSQLNVEKITKHTYPCSKHFITFDGPTDEYPDPCDAQTGELRKSRRLVSLWATNKNTPVPDTIISANISLPEDDTEVSNELENKDVSCQTEQEVFSAMDMLAQVSRIRQLEEENEKLAHELNQMKLLKKSKEKSSQTQAFRPTSFQSHSVSKSKINKLFEFYTGLTYNRFIILLAFLFPPNSQNKVVYEQKRKETNINTFPLSEQVFMYLCRLRNGLNVKDLAFRFNIKVPTVSTVLTAIAKYMYIRLGSISYWPHRNTIIHNMSDSFKADFPTCLAILDCTEIKTEKPSSLKVQSQCFSDYKSSNTLKSLVVCDPRGSILFVSDLFSGSISDNDICVKSGFYDYLRQLKESGYIQTGDALMADKGFRIEKELKSLDIELNIPPFASSANVFSEAEVNLTRKIAGQRIHVERAINRIKCFKLLKRKIPISLFHCINENWFVAAILTNYQDTLVKI